MKRRANPATTAQVFDTLQRHVTVRVKITGHTNFARAGNGADAKTASSTSDAIGLVTGTNAALAAAAKYFGCEHRQVMLLLVQDGDVSKNQPAIFDARCTTKLETPIKITPAAKPLPLRRVRGTPTLPPFANIERTAPATGKRRRATKNPNLSAGGAS